MNVTRRFIFLLIAGWIMQAAVVPFISFGAVQPDIVLVIVATFGFFGGPAPGALGGFAGGLLQDLLAPGSVGLGVLVKTLVGYLSGQVERTILGDSVLMPFLAVGGVSLVSQTLYIGLAFLVGEPIELVAAIKTVVIPNALYTGFIALFIFPPLSRVLSAERHATVFR